MDKVSSLTYVSKSQEKSLVLLGADVDPFNRATELGTKVWYDGIFGLSWKHGDQHLARTFDERVFAYPTPNMDSIVVIFGHDSKQYPAPDNAILLNADGTVRMRLVAPTLLSKIDPNTPGRYVLPPGKMEGPLAPLDRGLKGLASFYAASWYQDAHGRTQMKVSFYIGNTDLVEDRHFDPTTGKCMELLRTWWE